MGTLVHAVLTWQVSGNGGELLTPISLEVEPASLNIVSQYLPQGAYTTFRTFNGVCALCFSDHLARLEHTAYLAGKPINISREKICQGLREAIQLYGNGDVRVRLTVDLEKVPGTIFISIEPLTIPTIEDYQNGVKAVTRQLQRQNPKAKLTNFIETAGRIREELPAGIHEALMRDEAGVILEGLSSNFFAVYEGKIWTAEEGVLSGITRSLVLDEAQRAGIDILYQGVHVDQLPQVQEAFITSSTRAVLAIVNIDKVQIGSGKPGGVTNELLNRYQLRIKREIEPI